MKTTLRKILDHEPCGLVEGSGHGWDRGVKAVIAKYGKLDLDTEVTPMEILEVGGIKDAVWCLQAFDYFDYCLFLADVAESVIPIYEEYNKNSLILKRCIFTIRLYHDGMASMVDLIDAFKAALKVCIAANNDYNIYAMTAYVTDRSALIASGAACASCAVHTATRALAFTSATNSVRARYYFTSNLNESCADNKNGWKEIEQLFIKHFNKYKD